MSHRKWWHDSATYPPNNAWGIEGWHMLSDFYEDEFDDTAPITDAGSPTRLSQLTATRATTSSARSATDAENEGR
jgi:hypothetical protein